MSGRSGGPIRRGGEAAGGDPLVERAALIRAVAHPVRLTHLGELREGPRCATHIRDLLGVPQPNVSQHLAVLRRCGVVASCRNGARRCYYLPRPALVDALLAVVEGEYPVTAPSRQAVIAAAQRALRTNDNPA